MLTNNLWTVDRRPGFFGRRRDEIVAGLDARHGKGNWKLQWLLAPIPPETHLAHTWDFEGACYAFYEESYFRSLSGRPAVVDEICDRYSEVYDNAVTFDYSKQ
jgi:hypothetical protein